MEPNAKLCPESVQLSPSEVAVQRNFPYASPTRRRVFLPDWRCRSPHHTTPTIPIPANANAAPSHGCITRYRLKAKGSWIHGRQGWLGKPKNTLDMVQYAIKFPVAFTLSALGIHGYCIPHSALHDGCLTCFELHGKCPGSRGRIVGCKLRAMAARRGSI